MIQAFLELVTKLNEATFRPLFRRLFDWAFAIGKNRNRPYRFGFNAPTDGETIKQVTFCRLYSALLEYFKAGLDLMFARLAINLYTGTNELVHDFLASATQEHPERIRCGDAGAGDFVGLCD
jgi:hypothetical protein